MSDPAGPKPHYRGGKMVTGGGAIPASLVLGEGVGAPHAPARAFMDSNRVSRNFGQSRATGSRPYGLRTLGRLGRHRAAGVPRTIARRRVPMHASSRVGVEWSAPSYAGHTGWSRHAAAGSGHKRKTRSEWQMTRDTHPALVMDTEAETMLSQLEPSRVGDAVSRAKASINATNRRAGLLCTPDGTVWSGHATHCRRKCNGGWHGRLVPADLVELAVLGQ